MAEIVLALGITLHVLPFEIDAAAGAFLADSLEEIHGDCGAPLGVGAAAEISGGCSVGDVDCSSIKKCGRAITCQSSMAARVQGCTARMLGAG